MNDHKLMTLKDWVSITRLASYTNLDRSYVSSIINGQKKCSEETAFKLATACNQLTHRVGLYQPSDFNDEIEIQSNENHIQELMQLITCSIATLDEIRLAQDESAKPILNDFSQILELSNQVELLKVTK